MPSNPETSTTPISATAVDLDLRGRTALVTGAASGLGLACARRLASAGALVTVADIDAERTEAAASEIGGRPWVVDLTDVAALAAVAIDADVLVNNAGRQVVSPLEEFDPADFSSMLRLMLEAPFLLVRAVLPGMYANGFGRIIHMSSVHGHRASKFKSAYVTAKHGLEGLSKVVALEGAAMGVTSNTICPSYAHTPLVDAQVADQARLHHLDEQEVIDKIMLTEPAIKRFVEPEEVAELVAYLCCPAASFITGASLAIDGGWRAH